MSEKEKPKMERKKTWGSMLSINLPVRNRSANGSSSKKILFDKKQLQRSTSVSSTLVHVKSGKKNFEDLEKEDNVMSNTKKFRIRTSVQRLVDGVEERSINTYLKTTKYMDNDLKKPAQRLKQVLRRSVHRTRTSRSHRKISKKMSRRYDKMFGSTDPVFSSNPELTKLHEENLVMAEAQSAMELKEELEQQRQASLEILIEGKIEQLKHKGVGKKWKPRYGVLNSEGLRYFDSREDFVSHSKPVGVVAFGDLVTTKGDIAVAMAPTIAFPKFERSYVFMLTSEKEKLYFSIRRNEHFGLWVKCLNRAFTGFIYHKGKEAAIRSSLTDDWVSRNQWRELQQALSDPTRKNVALVKKNIKISLLDYLENLVSSRVNLTRLQTAFIAWKTLVQVNKKRDKNEQLLYLGKRHSFMAGDREANSSNSRPALITRSTSNKRLKNRQKSRGFDLKVGEAQSHNTLEILP